MPGVRCAGLARNTAMLGLWRSQDGIAWRMQGRERSRDVARCRTGDAARFLGRDAGLAQRVSGGIRRQAGTLPLLALWKPHHGAVFKSGRLLRIASRWNRRD